MLCRAAVLSTVVQLNTFPVVLEEADQLPALRARLGTVHQEEEPAGIALQPEGRTVPRNTVLAGTPWIQAETVLVRQCPSIGQQMGHSTPALPHPQRDAREEEVLELPAPQVNTGTALRV